MHGGTHARVPARAFRGASLKDIPVRSPSESRARFYLRFGVTDRAGVLARIAGVLGGFDVSIEQMVQEGGAGRPASIVMVTHEAREGDVRGALHELDRLRHTTERSIAIRIEEE